MLGGIRHILVISTPYDSPVFRRLLGTGSQWGISFEYAVQPRPEGLAQAYIIGADFVGRKSSALILGDNVFYGHGMPGLLKTDQLHRLGATVFGYHVTDPQRYGVVEFNDAGVAAMTPKK
jgi:glucose-1-phosphate thymidylyltransferase